MNVQGLPKYDSREYQARILRVVDGDTLDALLALGDGLYREVRIRLMGCDAIERSEETPERSATRAVRGLVEQYEGRATVLHYESIRGKYGRMIADVFVGPYKLSAWLIQHELAEEKDYADFVVEYADEER